MSAYLYGRLQLHQATNAAAAATDENKFIAAVAGLIPTEVVALHALFLARWTTTNAQGTTTITNGDLLGFSIVPCLLLGPALYLWGRKRTSWEGSDWIRLLMPAAAFVAWAALIGTSALTPLVAGRVPVDAVWISGVILGGILVLLSKWLG